MAGKSIPLRDGKRSVPMFLGGIDLWMVSASWFFLIAAVILWGLQGGLGDRWWPATVLLFGPKWIWMVPLIAWIPWAALRRKRSLLILLTALAVVAGPVMGFCFPWRTWLPSGARSTFTIRVLTCNVRRSDLNQRALADLVASTGPDLVMLQEWPDGLQASALFPPRDWHLRIVGEFCLASRYPIQEVEPLSDQPVVRYRVRVFGESIPLVNVHFVSIREGLYAIVQNPFQGAAVLEANTERRVRESKAASRWVSDTQGPLILAGDFNLPCESAIYRRFWSRYGDAFSEAGVGYGSTWFSRWHGLRIDHILTRSGWEVLRCWVGPDVGSDHRPVLADLRRLRFER